MTGTGQRATVVIVDDEQIVVTSIRAFLEIDSEFEVLAFTDVRKLKKCFESRQVDVVVSDYRMPLMNGLDLLARIKQIQPEATRVLLTSHADAESAIKAINEVSLYQYLEKPWDNEQLLLVVRGGAERSRILRELSGKIHELDSAHRQLKDVQKRLIMLFYKAGFAADQLRLPIQATVTSSPRSIRFMVVRPPDSGNWRSIAGQGGVLLNGHLCRLGQRTDRTHAATKQLVPMATPIARIRNQ